MNSDVKSPIFNVVGGIIVAFLMWLNVKGSHRLRSFHLQRLLGFQFKTDTEIRMVYGQLLLARLPGLSGITHPYVKAPRRGGAQPLAGSFSIVHPVSECEVRASTYIASLIGLPGNLHPLLVSDTEVSSILDSSFISFGGGGFKLQDC
jgi:hypothetical protein